MGVTGVTVVGWLPIRKVTPVTVKSVTIFMKIHFYKMAAVRYQTTCCQSWYRPTS